MNQDEDRGTLGGGKLRLTRMPAEDAEIAAMHQDALVRAEKAWTEVSARLAQNAPGSEIERIYAAEGRAIRIVCLMLYHEAPSRALLKPKPKGARKKPERSKWTDRGRVLERLDEALIKYVGGFPVGASQDLPFAFDVARAVGALRQRIRDEAAWRREREEGQPMPHGIAAVAWRRNAKSGPSPVLESLAALVQEYGVGSDTLAQLESLARLPVRPFVGLDGTPLLPGWDPAGDETLFLPPGDPQFDSQLRDPERVRAWERRLKR